MTNRGTGLHPAPTIGAPEPRRGGATPGRRRSAPPLPGRLRVGGRHVRLPDRGRRRPRRPRAVDLGHVRGRRPARATPAPWPPTTAAAWPTTWPSWPTSASPPTGSRSPGPASSPTGAGAVSQPGSTSTGPSSTSCWPTASSPSPPSTTGTSPRPSRTPAAGRPAPPPSGSPTTPPSWPTPSATGCAAGPRSTSPGARRCSATPAGIHAPGRTDPGAAVAAAHHLLLGHGLAVDALRAAAAARRDRRDRHHPQPLSGRRRPPTADADLDAARRIDGIANRLWYDPVLRGRYPDDVLDDLAPVSDLAHIRDGDLAQIARPIDALGLNYYRRYHVRHAPGASAVAVAVAGVARRRLRRARAHAHLQRLGGRARRPVRRARAACRRLRPPAAVRPRERRRLPRRVGADGRVHDADRRAFLDAHVRAVPRRHRRRRRPARLLRVVAARQLRVGRGLPPALRHRARRLRHPGRTPKASALWYRDVVAANRTRPGRPIDRRPAPSRSRETSDDGRSRWRTSPPGPACPRATVSRVVNGSPQVSDAARRAVEAAIEEMGYAPNRAARSLAGSRSETVALVVSEPSVRLFADPFFAGTTLGVTGGLAATRYQLVLLMVQARPTEPASSATSCGAAPTACCCCRPAPTTRCPAGWPHAGIPCVMAGRPAAAPAPPVGFVDADNEGGARGRRRPPHRPRPAEVGTVAGPADMAPGADRRTGWRAGAGRGRAARPATPWWPRRTSPGRAARRATGRCSPGGPTSTACSRRPTSWPSARSTRLRAAGRRVPDDVAVVGLRRQRAGPDGRPAAHHGPPADRAAGRRDGRGCCWPSSTVTPR